MEVKDGDFLIYGGLTVNSEDFLKLSNEVWKIRKSYEIDKSEKIKFNPGPKHLSHEDFIGFKSDIIQAAANYDCKFLVYHALHDIVQDVDLGRRNGINELCLNFTYLLKNADTLGMILVDRFNDKGNKIEGHLTEKFSTGLTGLPNADEFRLKNVVGIHYSAIGQSHMPSLIDIVLGSYRFALNSHCRKNEKNLKSAKTILKSLKPLFPTDPDGVVIPRIAMSFSPLDVRVPKYKQKYVEAIEFLRDAGLPVDQTY